MKFIINLRTTKLRIFRLLVAITLVASWLDSSMTSKIERFYIHKCRRPTPHTNMKKTKKATKSAFLIINWGNLLFWVAHRDASFSKVCLLKGESPVNLRPHKHQFNHKFRSVFGCFVVVCLLAAACLFVFLFHFHCSTVVCVFVCRRCWSNEQMKLMGGRREGGIVESWQNDSCICLILLTRIPSILNCPMCVYVVVLCDFMQGWLNSVYQQLMVLDQGIDSFFIYLVLGCYLWVLVQCRVLPYPSIINKCIWYI